MVLYMDQNDDGDVRVMFERDMIYVRDTDRGLLFSANGFENEDGWVIKTGPIGEEREKTIEVETREQALEKYFIWSVGICEFNEGDD